MSSRIKRLATDWKSYASLVAGAGATLTMLADRISSGVKAVDALKALPPHTKWITAAVLAGLAVLGFLLALGRKSTLLRPDRFVVSADEPGHLVGRDTEIKALASECERHPLVFLQGESGSGKSALVQAGLLPFYAANAANQPP